MSLSYFTARLRGGGVKTQSFEIEERVAGRDSHLFCGLVGSV